jgi:hypothetical protein
MLIMIDLKKLSAKFLLSMTLFILIFAPIGASADRTDSVQVLIDGQKISFDVPPRIENGRVLVPFRAVFTPLGGKVSWKAEKKLVVARYGLMDLRLYIGDTTARLGNKNINMDVPAKIIQGRTLVPLRFISENLFSAHVHWDSKNKTVSISSAQEKDLRPLTAAFQSTISGKKPGDIIDISHLEIMNIPEIIPQWTSHPQYPVTLLFSDSPEYVDLPGVTYRGKAQGEIRLVYYHIPRLTAPSRMALVAYNPGKETAQINIKRQVSGDSKANRKMWQDLGADVTLDYLNQGLVSDPIVYPIPAGSHLLINPGSDYYRTGELMYGITDLFSDRELEFSFILLPQTEMDEVFTKAKDPVLPADGRHDRGTFPGGDRLLEITLGLNLNGFLIGDGFSDPALVGKDQATGLSAQLLGNYGVHYRMKASFDVSAAILLIPLGGDIFSGGIAASEELFSLNKVSTFRTALYLGEYHKGDQAEWSFMPPAGSSLPVLIISVPKT